MRINLKDFGQVIDNLYPTPVDMPVNENGKCVIYVVGRNRREDDNSLAEAQKYALRHKLPLAVVHCADQKSVKAQMAALNNLRALEAELAELSIPLIVLIGRPERVLPSLFHHTKPRRVFIYSQAPAPDARQFELEPEDVAKLQKHPYPWPGTVIPLSKLIVIATESLC